MTYYPDERQLDLIDYLNATADDRRYTVTTLAHKYGLSDGQALTLIAIHGRSRKRLDRGHDRAAC
ncbi:hypothetical protein [Aminobacter sp. AP02]|uniref:hypothetical protein n=1 Tax=Aminobacter sp. AP02 TaxID=2135737 RepID=UPI000D6D10D9|nr:hypothetical protein [Aminobacter sp. AP02]PWK61736.1 hypothetical protein C8K44_1328 [Aminobacter sp. AP02]